MNRDITANEAKQIAAGIRRKMVKKLAVIRTPMGYKIKPANSCTNSELLSDGFIGVYTKKTSHLTIMADWNDTL